MADLAQDFFKRDLDDGEWQQLGQQLAGEDPVADRFLEEAAGYYASLGLPEPKAPRGSAGGGFLGGHGGLLLGLLLGTAVGASAVLFLRVPNPLSTAPLATEAPAQALPAATSPSTDAHPKPITRASGAEAVPAAPVRHAAPTPLSRPSLSPAPSGNVGPREASPGFPGLAAVVELQRQGLVTARVLDAKGEEQRLLYAGVLEPGRWSFGWDGMDLTGRRVPAGTYTIEVQEGSRVLRKQVLVSARREEAR